MLKRYSILIPITLVMTYSGAVGQEQPSRSIDIGSHQLYVRIVGKGSPALVIDVGSTSRSEEWYPLQDRIAEKTLVLTYDRAGYGMSEPGPLPRDSRREADELKRLLNNADISGPYILVGHSLGALNVQIFTKQYPEDVAGLILLDPPPLSWLLGDTFPTLKLMFDQTISEWEVIAGRSSDSSTPEQEAEAAFFRMIASELRSMQSSARLVADIESFGDIPLIVIASGIANPAFGDVAEEYQAHWINQSRTLSKKSTQGQFIFIKNSTHQIHIDAPDLVLNSILTLLSKLQVDK